MHAQRLKDIFFYYFSFLSVWWWAKCCKRTYNRLYVTDHHWVMYASSGRGQQSWAAGNHHHQIMVTVALIRCLLEQGAGLHIYLTKREVWPGYSIGPLSLWALFSLHPAGSALSHPRSNSWQWVFPEWSPTRVVVSPTCHAGLITAGGLWAAVLEPPPMGTPTIQWDPLLCLPVSAPQAKRRWKGARSSFHCGSLWIFTSEI